MLSPVHIGILLTLGLMIDSVQLILFGMSIFGKSINAVPLIGQIGSLTLDLLANVLSMSFSAINLIILNIYTKLMLRKSFKGKQSKKLLLRWVFSVAEILPILNFMPFWTIYVISISFLGRKQDKV